MAIDTTDQTTPTVGEDGGASLSADDIEVPIEEEELVSSAAPAGQPARQGQQPGKRQGGASTRGDRRKAFDGVSKQLEEKLTASMRNEMSTMRTEFSRMLSGIQQPQQRQQAPAEPAGPNPFDAQLADIDAARDAELKLMQARKPGEAFDFTRYRKLDNDRTALLARREAMQVLQSMGLTPQVLQQMRQGGGRREVFSKEAVYMNRFERLREEFPHMGQDGVAGLVGAHRKYLASIGRPDTYETDREAAASVMAQLGLSSRPVPRGREGLYAAPGAGERGAGGRPAAKEVRLPAAAVAGLSKDEQEMARQFLFGGAEA